MERRDKDRSGLVRQERKGLERHGGARIVKAGEDRRGRARNVGERRGLEWIGRIGRIGRERYGLERSVLDRQAWQDWRGAARRGSEWMLGERQGRRGKNRKGMKATGEAGWERTGVVQTGLERKGQAGEAGRDTA